MTELFLAVLRVSLLAAVVTLIVLLLRWGFRRLRLPAGLCAALWLAVLVRMVLPAGAVTSAFSLLRWSAPAVERQVEAIARPQSVPQAPSADGTPASVPQSSPPSPALTPPAEAAAPPSEPAEAGPGPADALAWVWSAGALSLWAWAGISSLRLSLGLRAAVRRGQGQDLRWESDRISSPFVFGLLRPKIYVPAGPEGDTLTWVLRHERAHLRLGHHWMKPLFFLALGPHWFNPVLWLAWALFCRDLELCCDEYVLRRAPEGGRAYSAALLSLAVPRPGAVLPPGFGETGVKERIRRALRYRRPAWWAIAAAAALAVICFCCLVPDPAYPALPRERPVLTVGLDGQTLEAGCAPAEEALWSSALPDAQLTTGWPEPYLDLDLSMDGQRPPDRVACTEYRILDGRAQSPLERHTDALGGSAGYLLRLFAREDASGTGMEKRLICFTCTWESGADRLALEYAFLLTLPSVKAGGPPADPVVVVDGQRLDGTEDPSCSAPYGSVIYITLPQDSRGGEHRCSVSLNSFSSEEVYWTGGNSTGLAFQLSPHGAPDGSAPDQTQCYTLSYTLEDGTQAGRAASYAFTIHAFQPPPELDRENWRIRWPGGGWTDLLSLLPAPAQWAEQDLAGRDRAVTLQGLTFDYFQAGFTSSWEGWAVAALSHGPGGNRDVYFYRSRDGGRTWSEYGRPRGEALYVPSAVFFPTAGRGFIAFRQFEGAPVYGTEDGGTTWTELALPLPDRGGPWECVSIVFDSEGLTGRMSFTSGQNSAYRCVLSTEDGGASWAPLSLWTYDSPEEIPLSALPRPQYSEAGELSADLSGWYGSPVHLLGDLPEEDVALYGLRAELCGMEGVLLRRGRRLDYFPEIAHNTGPRTVLAGLAMGDYDGDGTGELAVSLCTGTGTGVSVWELHLFEPAGEGFALSASLTEEDFARQVSAQVESELTPDGCILRTGDVSRLCDLSGFSERLEEGVPNPVGPGAVFSFFLASPIQCRAALCAPGVPLCYIADYTAGVIYDGRSLALDPASGDIHVYDEFLPRP